MTAPEVLKEGLPKIIGLDVFLPISMITKSTGKNVMVELHMTFVPLHFLIMDMEKNTSCPIILERPFLRTSGAVIDCKECNVKFQFPHKKPMEHFPRKKELCGYDIPHAFRIT